MGHVRTAMKSRISFVSLETSGYMAQLRDVISAIGGLALVFVVSCGGRTEPSSTAFLHRNAADLFGIDHVPQFEFIVPDDQSRLCPRLLSQAGSKMALPD